MSSDGRSDAVSDSGLPSAARTGADVGRDGDERDAGRRPDPTVVAVVAVAVVAVAARLVGLGDRPFHWDEARVGYWTLRFLETGAFDYRPIAGGPLLYHANRLVFALLGPSDAAARLPVAAIGGLLPLAALLFRGRLRDGETVALAVFLAANPLLVYYSRFLRGDVPLAAFGVVAVGAAARLLDTGARRYLYAAAAALGLALASSGFVVGYLGCWLVAAWLVFDHPYLAGRGRDRPTRLVAVRRRLDGWATPLARAAILWFAIVFFCYAPRAGESGGPGLWRPETLPAVFETATFGAVRSFVGVRVVGRAPGGGTHELIPYVVDTAAVMAYAALPLSVLALGAFVADRYRVGGPRPLVAFHSYWGLAAIVVFPMITEVNAPWVAIHVAVPLSVPAAVGAAALVRHGTGAVARRDAATVAAAVLVVVAVVSQVGAVGAAGVYGPPERDNRLAQYAQPADDLDPLVANASRAIAGSEGVDVLFVGERFSAPDGDEASPPVAANWGNRLPLPWYFERLDAETQSVGTVSDLDRFDRPPPVVVADPAARDRLADRLRGYDAVEYRLALRNRRVVVFTRR